MQGSPAAPTVPGKVFGFEAVKKPKSKRAQKIQPRRRITERPETRRARIQARECSWRWAEDIWFGHDVDCNGHRTGSGTLKVRCAGTPKKACGRFVPPQDVVNSVVWPPRKQPNLQGPPPPPVWICTDCRTIAREPKPVKPAFDGTVIRGFKLRKAAYSDDHRDEYETVAFADLIDDDSSNLGAVVDALARENVTIESDALPAEDEETLRRAVAVFNASGELADFARAAGDEVEAEQQRRRYGASKKLTV